jgi:very-short-patch-repair endonuclease
VHGRGVPRWVLRLELRAGRWQRVGRQVVVTHNGPLTPAQRRAAAALEVGPRAALDGWTALQQHGVRVEDDGVLHVIAPKSSNPLRCAGARVHESRRFREDDVGLVDGVRTVVPAVAAVHAALWARTDREATLALVLAVQQRLARPEDLAAAALAVRRSPRRRLLGTVVLDVADGARSMGELDVARALRSRGLPEPARQVLRRRPSGRQYLDCRFEEYGITLEVDGSQHADPLQVLADLLRDLALVSEGDTVLRLPLVAWRLAESQVLDALQGVFSSRGWRRHAA